jgi:hypothetical protein
MSIYQLHRCIYDWVRAGEVNSTSGDGRLDFDASVYELTDVERTAFESRDIVTLYRLGLHEVLLNRYCRAAGFERDDYRRILEPAGMPGTGTGRWQRSTASTGQATTGGAGT